MRSILALVALAPFLSLSCTQDNQLTTEIIVEGDDEVACGVSGAPGSHTRYYQPQDNDGDGYAGDCSDYKCFDTETTDENGVVTVTETPPGDVPEGWLVDEECQDATSDCDDDNNQIHPDAEEICDTVDNDCDDDTDEDLESVFYADADGDGFGDIAATDFACDAPDGYVADATDCDDTNGEISPEAEEVCNLVDDDCDGTVDEDDAEDAPAWYQDFDRDGYGDLANRETSCSQPDGYVSDFTDCDDQAYAINSAAPEECDGVDNDCDLVIDENDAIGVLPWYADTDGDGHGDAAVSTIECDAPDGYVGDNTDCDDTNADANPAEFEDCATTYDDDCDGTTSASTAIGASSWYADGDGDGDGGTTSAATTACSAPVGYVSTNTDCDDARAETYAGADEYCNSHDDDCDGTTDEDDALDATTWYIDADADGYGSSAFSTDACSQPTGFDADADDCNDGDDTINPSAVEECDGTADENCDGEVDVNTAEGFVCLSESDGVRVGEYPGDNAGYAVATGDITGDSRTDLLVGAPAQTTRSTLNGGAVYLIDGPVSGSDSVASASSVLVGEGTNWAAGVSLCTGDFTGDGTDDMVVGATGDTDAGINAGTVYVVTNPASGESSLSSAWAKLDGDNGYDEAGGSVACGDVGGDAYVIVGARYAGSGDPGVAYLVTDLQAGAGSLTNAHATLEGVVGSDPDNPPYTGGAVAVAEDSGGDVVALVAASGVGVYLEASPSGTVSLALADVTLAGTTSYRGWGLATGDLDGDGYFDVVVGDHRDDSSGSTDAGIAYALLGPFTSDRDLADGAQWFGSPTGASFGAGVSVAIGDFDDDSRDDALIGATLSDGDAGAAYVVLGGASVSDVDLDDADYVLFGAGEEAAGRVAIGDLDDDGFLDAVIGAAYGSTSAEGAVYVVGF